jgi:hypothetical protein
VAAAEWIRARVPPADWDHAALACHFSNEYDLLWEIPPRPDETKNNMLHLFRAAAFIRERKPADARRQLLVNALNSSRSPDQLRLYARYLLGLEDEATVLKSPKHPSDRCDVAYFVGLKKASERKYAEAMDWFQSALETGQDQTPIYNMVVEFLAGWARTEKSFRAIEAEGL